MISGGISGAFPVFSQTQLAFLSLGSVRNIAFLQ